MNRKKQLLAWILAFVMVLIQLPAVEIFAETYDFNNFPEGETYDWGYVVPGDKLLINSTGVTFYYVLDEVDVAVGDIYTPILNIKDIPAAATAYQQKVDSGYVFLNWHVALIKRSGNSFEFKLNGNWLKRVTDIDISSQALPDVTSGETLYKCFQLTAVASPDDASNKTVTWAVYDSNDEETDKATLTDDPSNGGAKILKVKEAGEYRVRVSAEDGFGTFKDFPISVENIPVTGIEVSSENNATTVTKGRTLNMSAEVTPQNATNKNVTWSVAPGTGNATIDNNGVLTATAAGTATITATSMTTPNTYATKLITITARKHSDDDSSGGSSSVGSSAGGSSSGGSSSGGSSSGGSSSVSKPVDSFQALSADDRSDIENNLKEYLPDTLLESKGLTVEMLDTLTYHKFTKEYLNTFVNNPELIKETFGIDVKAMIKYVSLEPVENPHFKDVANHWAKDNILNAANEGFAAGVSEGVFAPDQALQSADTLTFLNRVLLKNDITYNKLPRSSVDKYLKDKDHWAYHNMASVCAKLDEKTVKTIMELEDEPITRELLAQILFELTKDYLEPTTGQEFGMKDIDESEYKEAIEFCLGTGLLYGTSEDTMSPKKVLTRAEMMAILTRLNDLLSK